MNDQLSIFDMVLGLIRELQALLGVVVGAFLHHLFTRSAERKRHERMLAIESYTDYIRSIGEMESTVIGSDPQRRADAISKAIAAKVKICAYGSAPVVHALSQFEGAPGNGLTPEKKQYLTAFLEAVRMDCGASKPLATDDALQKILFAKP